MKYLAIVAMFLLMGCQTTNTVPPKDTSPKVEPKVEETQEKAGHQGKKLNVPTVIRTSKPVFCGDPTITLNAVLNVAKEKPLAMWKDVQTGYNVIMLYNKETRQNTILEYIPGPYACFLSMGKDVHIVGVDFPPKKTGISVQRGLTKPLKHGINIVQFDDAD